MNYQATRQLIRESISAASNPVVLWSGGKDSQTMLYLAREVKPDIRVVYFRLADDDANTRKNAFIHEFSFVWKLSLEILEPFAVDIVANGNHVEAVHFFQVADVAFHVGMQSDAYTKASSACILSVANTERAPQKIDADLILHGHKDSDADTMYGNAPLLSDSFTTKQAKVLYPLREWTDADIWAFTRQENIPQNWRRYAKDGTPLKSVQFNNDYYSLCSKCCTPNQSLVSVTCPKAGLNIPYIGDLIPSEQNMQSYKAAMQNIAWSK